MIRSLTIVIPAFNEEQRLPATIGAVQDYLSKRDFGFVELLIVDDGSTDSTAAVVRLMAREDARIRLLEDPGNRGKGYAVRQGMREARGEWVLFSDADLSTPIEELDKLITAIEKNHVDGAIGSRAINRALVEKPQSSFRELSGRLFNLTMKILTGLKFRDTQCGFKLFSAEVAASVSTRQQIEGFGFDVEVLFIAKKRGFRITEVPVRWINAEGTKVSFWKGLDAFGDLLRMRRNDARGDYR
jgi:dolichyl-phosphate beta-glucosyltransferase